MPRKEITTTLISTTWEVPDMMIEPWFILPSFPISIWLSQGDIRHYHHLHLVYGGDHTMEDKVP